MSIKIAPLAKQSETERIQVYQRILTDIFAEQNDISIDENTLISKFSSDENHFYLYLGQRPPSKTWQRAALNIDRSDPIYVIYDKERLTISDLTDLIPLKVTSPLNQAWIKDVGIPNTPIAINNLMSVERLLTNKKVDAVVLSGEQVYLANHDNKFQVDVLVSGQPIYLYFPDSPKGDQLRQRFDQQFLTMIQTGRIKQLFANDALLTKANIQTPALTNTINWHIVPKVYNPKTNELETSSFELTFTQTLKSLMPNYQFSTTVISGRMAQSKLASTQPTCVLNAIKLDDEGVYKSHTTYQFLQPQLYQHHSANKTLRYDDVIELADMLTQNSQLVIGIPEGVIAKKLAGHLSPKLYQRLKIFEPLRYQQMVDMFLAKRIDAIIIWPSLLQELLPDAAVARKLDSQLLSTSLFEDIPAFIACNLSPTNRDFIMQVNSLLEQSEQRDILFAPYFNGLDDATQYRLKEKLNFTITQ
ncbi:hypothetical protein [Thalassotalea fusca]